MDFFIVPTYVIEKKSLSAVVTSRLMLEGGALPAGVSFAVDFIERSAMCVPTSAASSSEGGAWEQHDNTSLIRLLMARNNRVERVWTTHDSWNFVTDSTLTLQRVLASPIWTLCTKRIVAVLERDRGRTTDAAESASGSASSRSKCTEAELAAHPDALFFHCYSAGVDVISAESILKAMLARK